jgi:formylglycine-generating enzyme required for sulfatase activity
MPGTKKGRSLAILTGVALVALLAVLVWVNREHIRFLFDFESLGLNAQGYAEFRHRKTGIIFVRLPGGEFWMGTSDKEAEVLIDERVKRAGAGKSGKEQITRYVSVEQPRHKVTLSPFLNCET